MTGLGLYMTLITGKLNVCTCAGLEYPCFYPEPWIFQGIIFLEIYGYVSQSTIGILYGILLLVILVKYLLFMSSVVTQLCNYLGINFITVKDKTKKAN